MSTQRSSTDPSGVRAFPPGFIWGVATAAYQVEGAVDEDGRKPSIWDTFAHSPDKIAGGDTGDVACDHYHRWPEDLDLLTDLAIPAYRFSVSWPRVQPDGRTTNRAGLDFYKRLVDGLLDRGIQPLVTLYHWDLPQALADAPESGWLARETVDRFVDFAQLVGKELGDVATAITTLNEPWCSAFLGYAKGEHAPGLSSDPLAYRAAHHLNLAHARSLAALRATVPPEVQLSVTLNLHHVTPASDDADDVAAAKHVDLIANRIFLDPMLTSQGYPEELLETTRGITDWGFVRAGDVAEFGQPIDFLGVNYYNPAKVAARRGDGPKFPGTPRAQWVDIPGPHTVMGWPIVPEGLASLLLRLQREYDVPMMVTENGCASHDTVGPDGAVHDADRIAYLQSHLTAVADAIDAGADVRGYYVWALLDNFEWAWGYDKRFGIVHVDFETQRRTPKDSAHWYTKVISGNALTTGA